jgi:hypothetical protein
MELYSVTQFFPDGQYETVRKHVPAVEAMEAVKHYTRSVGARLGTTVRVIITDMMDSICFEWEYGKGITFPTQQMMDEASDKLEKTNAAKDA